jgi:hypothetical protein
LQSFLCRFDYNEKNLGQILRYCKLLFSLIMLMLLCVQIVQTNNNEFKMGIFYLFFYREAKECELTKETESLN